MAEIFINYRTGDGEEAAELVATQLAERFGQEHVFKAAHSLTPGELFPQALTDAARRSVVLLAIMGQNWALAPRLRDEADWVRREILAAQSSGSKVIPVLKGRKTDRLVRDDLPSELRWLADVHSFRLDMQESTADLKQIGDFLADFAPALKAAQQSPGDAAATSNSATGSVGTVFQGRDFTGDQMNAANANAPVQQGDGNIQLNVLRDRLRALQALSQPIDHLRLLAERFVPPPGFADAMAAIREQGTVVLSGPPGSGRTAAARMLAFRSWSGEGTLHELVPQEPDDDSPFHIDPGLISRRDCMWLDLSTAEPSLWRHIQRELPVLHHRVQAHEARLVVIQPYMSDLPADFRHHQQRIKPPAPAQVFGRHLLAEKLVHDEQIPDTTFLKSPRTMADIRQFVLDILEARALAEGMGELADWIKAAEQPVSPRESRVSEAFDKLPSAADRALLLSVAMLHGAHADIIESAATMLLARIPDDSEAGLARSPLGDRLGRLTTQTDATGHVHFAHADYETAVRTYFWRHYPELHSPFAAWVGEMLNSSNLGNDDRTELAQAFAGQCLDARYQFRLVELVQRLTAQPSSSHELAAAAILQVGLADEANSGAFRRQIYNWSRGKDTSGSLITVLVASCQQMIETHPTEALVRLHHLARRHPQREDVRCALTDVVHEDLGLLGLLLARLGDARVPEMRVADARIFLDIVDASFLATSRTARKPPIAQGFLGQQLATAWGHSFTLLAEEQWTDRAIDWLSRAAEDEHSRDPLLSVLVSGARSVPSVFPRLYVLANRAQYRDAITQVVLAKISAAQGVELP
jgi:hypothetical protein